MYAEKGFWFLRSHFLQVLFSLTRGSTQATCRLGRHLQIHERSASSFLERPSQRSLGRPKCIRGLPLPHPSALKKTLETLQPAPEMANQGPTSEETGSPVVGREETEETQCPGGSAQRHRWAVEITGGTGVLVGCSTDRRFGGPNRSLKKKKRKQE